MLKRILLKTLNRFLGSYVENIDKHQLELGIFKGHVSVSDLRIKSSVISRIFKGRVVSNRIGSLRVVVPWRSFARRPVEIYVRGVDIKLGKAGFCWCFLGEGLCAECVEYEKYEFMNKMDKLCLLCDARSESPMAFEDLVMGSGFKVLVEDVNVEYVSGTPIGLRIQRIEFDRGECESGRDARVFNVVGVEVTGVSRVLGPLDVRSKIRTGGGGRGLQVSTQVEGLCMELRSSTLEEVLCGLREYSEDRIRWVLFRKHEEYRALLRTAREASLWEDQGDGRAPEKAGAADMWRHLGRLQKQVLESKGVVAEEIAGIMAAVDEYREALRRPSSESGERRRRCEKEMCLERLLKVRRMHASDCEKRSWRGFLAFGRGKSARERSAGAVPVVLSMKNAMFEFVDGKHQGFRVSLAGVKIRIKNLLSRSRVDLKGKGWKVFFVDTSLNEDDPSSELVALVSDARGALSRDGPNVDIKGKVGEWEMVNYKREILHCFEDFGRAVLRLWTPSYEALGHRGKFRAELRVARSVMGVDLERVVGGEAGRYGVESEGIMVSYVDDGVAMKKVASLTIRSSFVYRAVPGADEALSNKVEVTVLLVDEVFYVKTSMVDVYAHGVYPDGLGGGQAMFPVGFVVPNFEVCSEAVKISRAEGRVEVGRVKVSGNGGSVIEVEISRGRVVEGSGKVVCRVPKMKMEAVVGKWLFLDVHYLKVYGSVRRMALAGREMSWMWAGTGSSGAGLRIRQAEGVAKGRGLSLSICVSEYLNGSVRNIQVILNGSMVKVESLSVGKECECESVMAVVDKEDISRLGSLAKVVRGMGMSGGGGDFVVSVRSFLLRSCDGLEIRSGKVRLLRDEGSVRMEPLEISVVDGGCDGIALAPGGGEAKICIARLVKTNGMVDVAGSIRGEVMEATFTKIREMAKGVSVTSAGGGESSVSFEVSLRVRISGRTVGIECPKLLWRKGGGSAVSLQEVSILLRDGEDLALSEVRVGVSADGVEFSAKKVSLCLSLCELVSVLHPLLQEGGESAGWPEKMVVSIGEMVLKREGVPEVGIGDVQYDGRLTLNFWISNGGRSRVEYKRVKTRRGESLLLSVMGGCYEVGSLALASQVWFSEYVEICEKLGIQMSREPFHVLLMGLSGTVDGRRSFLRINLSAGHFSIQALNVLKGRVLCSADVYDARSMRLLPTVEENVVAVRKYGALLSVRMAEKLRIVYFQEVSDVIRGFFGWDVANNDRNGDPGWWRVKVRNATMYPIWVRTRERVTTVKGEDAHEVGIEYDEYGIYVGEERGGELVSIVNDGTTLLEVGGRRLVATVVHDGQRRVVTITHTLSFLNLCEVDLVARMRSPGKPEMEILIRRGSLCTALQAGSFFLEMGMDGNYVELGRMDMESTGRAFCKRPAGVWKIGSIVVGIDMVGQVGSSVTLVLYPTLEIVNRTATTLRVVLSVGPEAARVDGGGVLKRNIPFLIERECVEDVYDIHPSEAPLLRIHNIDNKSSAKVFEDKASIAIGAGHSGRIKKEECWIDAFFGRHVLGHKVRVVVCPFIMVVNHLGKDIHINGMRFRPGSSCADRIELIHSLCVEDYDVDGSVTAKKGAIRVVTLTRRSHRGRRGRGVHEGVMWTGEAVFGGLGPRPGTRPKCIRFLLEFKGDADTRVAEFRYAYLIRNQTGMRLLAVSEHACHYVEPYEEMPFNTSSNGLYLFIADCVDVGSLRSCGAFIPLDVTGTKHFRVGGPEPVLLGVSKTIVSEQHVFRIEAGEDWPYVVCNDSDADLKFVQRHDTVEHAVARGSMLKYALDSLMFDPVIVIWAEDKKIEVYLNKDEVVRGPGVTVCVFQAEGTRVVRVSRREVADSPESRAYFSMAIDSLAASLVDESGAEVLCGHLSGLEITAERVSRCVRGSGEQWRYVEWMASMAIEGIQIDNQDVCCVFPVVLHPIDKHLRIHTKKRTGGKFVVLDFTLGRSAHHVSVSNLYCRIQDFVLNVEERLFKRIAKAFGSEGEPGGERNGGNLRIQNLKVEKVRAKINVLKDMESDVVSNVIGFLINSISDVSLDIDGMKEACLYTTTWELCGLVTAFYAAQVRGNLYKVLTHLDLIGNLGSFTESVSLGIKDLFVEPTLSDTGVAHGIIRGGRSFLKNTIYGVSNTVGKLSKSIGTGARLVGCDKGFRDAKTHHPYAYDSHLLVPGTRHVRSPMAAILKGTGHFFGSVTSGITGIATSPIEGASWGVAGVMKGFGRGILGAFTKPIAGAADLVTDVSDTIKTSMGGRVPRIQYPRPPGLLARYDDGLSQGFYIFMTMVKRTEGERFVDGTFGSLNGRCQLVLTTRRMLVSNTSSALDVQFEGISVEEGRRGLRVGELFIAVERPSFVVSVRQAIGHEGCEQSREAACLD